MHRNTSFDAIWRAIEKALNESMAGEFDVIEPALWVEVINGYRKYDLRLASDDMVSATITLEQDALNGAVDEGALEPTEETPGGTSLLVEFCVLTNGYPAEDMPAFIDVVEDLWPEVEISHTRILEDYPASPEDEAIHEHFSLMNVVDFDFVDSVTTFLLAIAHTLEKLAMVAGR